MAEAHGAPPQALSIVAVDERGVSAVRLNEGLGLRDGDGFRYLCPALWGSDSVAHAHAIPDGPIVIGADTGLFLLSTDGRVERHPDPAAAFATTGLSASAAGLFVLQSGDTYRVQAVEADRVRQLWIGTEAWYDIAATDEFVQLVRVQSNQLYELRLSPSGDELLEQEAAAPEGTRTVLARAAGANVYTAAYDSSLQAQLGRIEEGSWVTVASAQVLLAGPIEVDDGSVVIGIDQQLSRFDGEQVEPLAETAPISCLRSTLGVSYACTEGGLRAVTSEGLAEPYFELEQLLPPDLEAVPEELRDACLLQWQRYQIDLLTVGISIGLDEGPKDGGVDAGAPPARGDDGGCGIAARREGRAPSWPMLAALLWTAAFARRRSRAG